MAEPMKVIKSIFGLSERTFNAPLYRLLNLHTVFAIGLKQIGSLVGTLHQSGLWPGIVLTARLNKGGWCNAILSIGRCLAQRS